MSKVRQAAGSRQPVTLAPLAHGPPCIYSSTRVWGVSENVAGAGWLGLTVERRRPAPPKFLDSKIWSTQVKLRTHKAAS